MRDHEQFVDTKDSKVQIIDQVKKFKSDGSSGKVASVKVASVANEGKKKF